MLTTVEGTYKDGRVELAEKPDDVTEAKVLVTFLARGNGILAPKTPDLDPAHMDFGMFPTLCDLTAEDFEAAEFRGDPDDGLDLS